MAVAFPTKQKGNTRKRRKKSKSKWLGDFKGKGLEKAGKWRKGRLSNQYNDLGSIYLHL